VPDAFGLDSDVYFGAPDQPLPDWRKSRRGDDDEDSPQPGVAAMLGFDPSELDDDDDEEEGEEDAAQMSIADPPLTSRSKTAQAKEAPVEAATPLAAAIQARLAKLLKKN
jgi:hypothetical protein